MKVVDQIPYNQTGYFSDLIREYLNDSPYLQGFYSHYPSLENVPAAIMQKEHHQVDCENLVKVLTDQYHQRNALEAVQAQIQTLLHPSTFTITTAHQPNILGGPLYCIYKVVSAIKLAQQYKSAYPDYHFVPVFYIGAEDHDLAELNHVHIHGKRYEWETNQSGSVGRMNTEGITALLAEIKATLLQEPFTVELMEVLETAYAAGNSVATATAQLFHYLFAAHGLLVLNPDDARLKAAFVPVMRNELLHSFSITALNSTNPEWEKHFASQVHPRAINLFYLLDNSRDRILKEGTNYTTATGAAQWSHDELFAMLESNPERFSPNVVLRPLFQETILPNIAFVGGGSEVAYWLQQQAVFKAAAIPMPMIYLRNSALLLNKNQVKKIGNLQLSTAALFTPTEALVKARVMANRTMEMKEELLLLAELSRSLVSKSTQLDATLKPAAEAASIQMQKALEQLEKKWIQTEKRKQEEQLNQLQQIKQKLFPNESLQERFDNFIPNYARQGKNWIADLIAIFDPTHNLFTIIEE